MYTTTIQEFKKYKVTTETEDKIRSCFKLTDAVEFILSWGALRKSINDKGTTDEFLLPDRIDLDYTEPFPDALSINLYEKLNGFTIKKPLLCEDNITAYLFLHQAGPIYGRMGPIRGYAIIDIKTTLINTRPVISFGDIYWNILRKK